MLFAHRVTTHESTKHSPFEFLYNIKSVLLIDITHNTKNLSNLDKPFDKDMFNIVLESVASLRHQIHHKVDKKVQEKHYHDYDLRHLKSNDIKVGDKSSSEEH